MSIDSWSGDSEPATPLMVVPTAEASGSAAGVVASRSTDRSPWLHHGEFGYEVRYERAAARRFRGDRLGGGWRRFGLLMLVLLVLGVTTTFCAGQPRVRSAIANLFDHRQSPPADHAAAARPGPVATAPIPTANHAGSRPTESPSGPTPPRTAGLTFAGDRLVRRDGSTATSCEAAEAADAHCVWALSVEPGNALDLQLTWSGAASLDLAVIAADGRRLQTSSGTGQALEARLPRPPSSLRVVVQVNSGTNVHFVLAIANHPI